MSATHAIPGTNDCSFPRLCTRLTRQCRLPVIIIVLRPSMLASLTIRGTIYVDLPCSRPRLRLPSTTILSHTRPPIPMRYMGRPSSIHGHVLFWLPSSLVCC